MSVKTLSPKSVATRLESIIQLGEPGAATARHDVSLLREERRGRVSILLHNLERVHVAGALLLGQLDIAEVAPADDPLDLEVSDVDTQFVVFSDL